MPLARILSALRHSRFLLQVLVFVTGRAEVRERMGTIPGGKEERHEALGKNPHSFKLLAVETLPRGCDRFRPPLTHWYLRPTIRLVSYVLKDVPHASEFNI